MMSRMDYQRVASIIKMERMKTENPEVLASLRNMMAEMCMRFGLDNPRFDSERFVTACGFGN